ncbi:hypothetical protein [Bdellovibrio sp. HCB209]|uniref:hypothetical protein n=1 Tax=Bdellovibrio sp. HCB209 TaxID=3394354 RepID=UPI0039B3C0A6
MFQLNRKTFTMGAILMVAIFYWKNRPVPVADGILIPEDPIQENIVEGQGKPVKIPAGVAEPLAHYKIRARVLSTNRYYFDPGAGISPIDLALGWGPMSDSRILKELRIGQSLRYYHVKWTQSAPISDSEIMRHSANVHIIPADDIVKEVLFSLREGHLIELKGELVVVSTKDGGEWRSSMSRDDRGGGACELMRVTSIRVLN